MILTELTDEESNAVGMALRPHRDLERRFGEDRDYLATFDLAMLGYRGFGERIAGDAIRKIDYVLHPKLKNLAVGEVLLLGDLSLSRADSGDTLSITVTDGSGVQKFRIVWDADGDRVAVTIQKCPADDPQYPHAPGVGYGTVMRDPDDAAENSCLGTLWGHDFHQFIDAMDVLRPVLADEIAAIPRQKPFMEGAAFSHQELVNIEIADVVRLDGGLPGRLCRHVYSAMLEARGAAILRSLSVRAEAVATWLEGQDCIWGGAAMTTHDGDNVMYAVRSAATGNLALLYNARNTSGPHTAFLAWKDASAGTATIVAARAGRHLFDVVASFLRGESPEAPSATIDLSSGKHDLGRETVETSILDLALCHVRFVESDLAELECGRMEMDESFERYEDFGFFVRANLVSECEDEDDAETEVEVPGL
jgi:hypothetical protein